MPTAPTGSDCDKPGLAYWNLPCERPSAPDLRWADVEEKRLPIHVAGVYLDCDQRRKKSLLALQLPLCCLPQYAANTVKLVRGRTVGVGSVERSSEASMMENAVWLTRAVLPRSDSSKTRAALDFIGSFAAQDHISHY